MSTRPGKAFGRSIKDVADHLRTGVGVDPDGHLRAPVTELHGRGGIGRPGQWPFYPAGCGQLSRGAHIRRAEASCLVGVDEMDAMMPLLDHISGGTGRM